MRIIAFDTETTGLSRVAGKPVCEGHRIIELACVEMSEAQTPPSFQAYFNPERTVDPGAFAVHGISDSFLIKKPLFAEKVDAFIKFIEGATLIAHNAPFDLQFINQELNFIGYPPLKEYCHTVIDTLALARQKYPGKKNSLDALCQRLSIDLSGRSLHGALKDSLLLLQVYRKLIGGQIEFEFSSEAIRKIAITGTLTMPSLSISLEEEQLHANFIKSHF
jgi:DNA polymerase-3 subunit epsilon